MRKITRREMLQTSALAGSASAVSWFGIRAGQAAPATTNPATTPVPTGSYSYFTTAEAAFVDAAIGRLIPADELGPGAREASVAIFIDRQLVGSYGRADTWYMQGPWKTGAPEQGYQLRLTPAQLYRVAIEGVNKYCRQHFGDKTFAELAADEQDKVLHGLESGAIELAAAPAKEFFNMLWQNTGEGYFADPMYGGNRAFAGWKLVGFPGPRYNYINEIEQYGKPYPLPPVGLKGRSGSDGGKD
jgi:gluconate 2-dehydrogenase gamma chain